MAITGARTSNGQLSLPHRAAGGNLCTARPPWQPSRIDSQAPIASPSESGLGMQQLGKDWAGLGMSRQRCLKPAMRLKAHGERAALPASRCRGVCPKPLFVHLPSQGHYGVM